MSESATSKGTKSKVALSKAALMPRCGRFAVSPTGLALLMLAGCAGPAAAAQSIVGAWATPGRCGVPLATVVVEPMGFSGEDFFCDFTEVTRTGDTVRWRGTCTFGIDAEAARVTARLKAGRLSYRINRDGWNGPLERCAK